MCRLNDTLSSKSFICLPIVIYISELYKIGKIIHFSYNSVMAINLPIFYLLSYEFEAYWIPFYRVSEDIISLKIFHSFVARNDFLYPCNGSYILQTSYQLISNIISINFFNLVVLKFYEVLLNTFFHSMQLFVIIVFMIVRGKNNIWV